jgi:thiamine biosynthesis lipoprotein
MRTAVWEAFPPLTVDTPLIYERCLRAMNTDIRIIVRDPAHVDLLSRAADLFPALEQRLSRFLPGSELSALNRRAGVRTPVSSELFEVLELAADMHDCTRGLFEPAVLGPLESAGYDRSFEEIEATAEAPVPAGGPRRSITEATLDPTDLSVTLPSGLRLDLGGIGKGYAVDRAARLLTPAGDLLVDAGGDIFASGDGPDGEGWLVAVAGQPRESNDLALVRLHDEALATSTTALRRWQRAGRWHNHLIDPRTGESVDNGVISASVLAPAAAEAEVLAKAALLLGPFEGVRLLEAHGRAGVLVLDDGRLLSSAMWDGRSAGEAHSKKGFTG